MNQSCKIRSLTLNRVETGVKGLGGSPLPKLPLSSPPEKGTPK